MSPGGRVADLEPGLYDKLIDSRLDARLDALEHDRLAAEIQGVEPAELADRVGEVLGGWARDAIAVANDHDRAELAIELSSALMETIDRVQPLAAEDGREITSPPRRLTAIERLDPTNQPLKIRQPLTPLRDTVLMTNARDEPSVGKEIEAEIESADRIDLILAFIRWTGIRPLLPLLRRHVEAGRELRVITTVYTGSTELRALEELENLGPTAHVKVSYDTTTTRLHAKAWLFERKTGFSTVYIGSSNLTFSAQVSGLEWNVRASQHSNPELISSFDRMFSTYWADPHFEPFEPETFAQATRAAGRRDDHTIITPFDIRPYPFQQRILEKLQLDRQRGHAHNLVAAATGTGKTVVAALDYRRLRAEMPRARLLFVAHRSEILNQSREMFRHVLRDGSFGELWAGGNRPERWDNVFASIQSISAHDAQSIDPEQFDVVIVDEFHHSAASSYKALLDHLRPKHLLGLTATPERADGLDVLRWFGGRISVELRLWDALEQGLLSPFHYFGIHDGVDLRKVKWRPGHGYDSAELTNLYTANDFWVSKVLAAVSDRVGDPLAMRALGFCVSIAHAEFMASRFARAGISARAITSSTSSSDRQRALDDLRDGNVNVLFTVDLFNEGIDLPAIDTVLMLRPTESATIFLQQLGRGLRRTEGKDVLTVLDFVGHQRKEFRFDLRYRAMLGRTRRELESDISSGFPYLPAGCRLDLDQVAREIVLSNIREALPTRWNDRVGELKRLGDIPFAEFLHETGLELDDIYRNNHTWTELRREARLISVSGNDSEKAAGRGIGRLLHIDDQDRLDTYRLLLDSDRHPRSEDLGERTQRQLQGLLLTMFNVKKATFDSLDDAVVALWQHTELRRELLELLPLLEDQVSHLHSPLLKLQPVPLQIHARYTREEVLAAFGASSVVRPLPLQTGVYWHEPTQTDLLFVTLQKADKDYSPTTRYLDYAISDTLFHWESQATTTANSPTGRRYINHEANGSTVALFIRKTKKDSNGRAMPYFCAGTATYVEHRSERPMQITWRLHQPLPGDVFADYRAAVA